MQSVKKPGYVIDILLMMLTVITFDFIPHRINVPIKYAILAYLFLKYIWYLSERKPLFTLLGAYTLILSVSSLQNTASLTWSISAFMTGLQLIVLFLVSSAVCQQIGSMAYVDCLIQLFVVLLLLNDALFLFIPYDFSNPDESYLLGNKFLVSYYHCFFSCLVYVKTSGKKHHWLTALLFVFSAVVALKVSCSTGVIMAAVLLAMMVVPKKLRKFLQNPQMLLGVVAVENALIWGAANIFSHPLVKSIVVNVFHKSPNMSGRSKLYAVTLDLVKDKPLLGYGHNTDIYRALFGYGNAQNGLFHIIIQAGILGAAVYFCAVFFGLRKKNTHDTPYGIYMYLFAMVVASAIEISLSLLFMLGVAILYGFITENDRKQIA